MTSIFHVKKNVRDGDAKSIARSLSLLRSIANFELLGVGAVAALLLVPGVLDEILAGTVMGSALLVLSFLRRSYSANREEIITTLEASKNNGNISEAEFNKAIVDLNTITIPR